MIQLKINLHFFDHNTAQDTASNKNDSRYLLILGLFQTVRFYLQLLI